MEKEIKYDLVKMSESELKDVQLKLDETHLAVMESNNKLEIQNYRIDNDIPQLESVEGLEKVKAQVKMVEDSMQKLNENHINYDKRLSEAELELTEAEDDDNEKLQAKIDKIVKTEKFYDQNKLRMKYDLMCGEKELAVQQFYTDKRMAGRLSNQSIRALNEAAKLHKDNLKVYADQIRNKARKVPSQRQNIKLGEIDPAATILAGQ